MRISWLMIEPKARPGKLRQHFGQGAPHGVGRRNAENQRAGAVQKQDAAVDRGADQSPGHAVDHVLIERLQALQFATRSPQPRSRPAQVLHQAARQIGHAQKGPQVDDDADGELAQVVLGGGVRTNHLEVGEFQKRARKDEAQAGDQVCARPRKRNRRQDHHQRIQQVKVAVYAAGEVDDRRDHADIADDLQVGLHGVIDGQLDQQAEESDQAIPQHHGGHEQRDRDLMLVQQRADGELDAEQKGDDDDPNADQPEQPGLLVQGFHGKVRRKTRHYSTRIARGREPPRSDGDVKLLV